MNPILRAVLVMLGCLHLAGGPYSLIQGYAWATMILDYSKETGWSQAVSDTFSGEKPCCLCRHIAAAKAKDSQENPRPDPFLTPGGKAHDPLFPPPILTVREPAHADFTLPGFPAPLVPVSRTSAGPPLPPPEC